MTELETLKQQVTEMQVTIERMEQEAEPKQWEPRHGRYIIGLDGEVTNRDSTQNYWGFGVSYRIKEQAEWAAKQMRSFNRLLCYVAEHTDGIPEDIEIETGWREEFIMITAYLDAVKRRDLNTKIKSGEVVL